MNCPSDPGRPRSDLTTAVSDDGPDQQVITEAPAVIASGRAGRLGDALAGAIAPVTGDRADAVASALRAAAYQARQTRASLIREKATIRSYMAAWLVPADDTLARWRTGDCTLSVAVTAWLLHGLRYPWIRDHLWASLDPAWNQAHTALLIHLARHAVTPAVTPAPLSLLAFTAWQAGNGPLAAAALDRAAAASPRYQLAGVIRQALRAGSPPSLARLPMTTAQVDDSYTQRTLRVPLRKFRC